MSDRLLSGFMTHDYLLTYSVADPTRRQRLAALCEGDWQGDEISDHTWEISNDLDPNGLEHALLAIVGDGDRAIYYYLTPPLSSGVAGAANAKRIFRVVIA